MEIKATGRIGVVVRCPGFSPRLCTKITGELVADTESGPHAV